MSGVVSDTMSISGKPTEDTNTLRGEYVGDRQRAMALQLAREAEEQKREQIQAREAPPPEVVPRESSKTVRGKRQKRLNVPKVTLSVLEAGRYREVSEVLAHGAAILRRFQRE